MNRIDAEFKKLWAAICCINKDCCLEEITYANLLAKVNSNTVEQKFYKITDRGDTGLILFGTDENHISLSGWGGFLNPDYQCQGDYSGVEALTGVPLTNTCEGVWYTLFESEYSTGDIVIWNGIHYQIIDWDAVDGNSPDINSTAYQILPKTLPGMGYIEETGAAQHLRDARIAAIYEGTNGIQAIDLVTRKITLSDGDRKSTR